jgi:hypothetical protein
MMHGPEKSDPAIVAGKPTNKAERSAAELVEPRAGTKGNAYQQSMHWTQSQVRVSQALERIRQAFAVTHPRWEPYAGKPHVRICAGGAQQWAYLPRKMLFAAVHESVHGPEAIRASCPGMACETSCHGGRNSSRLWRLWTNDACSGRASVGNKNAAEARFPEGTFERIEAVLTEREDHTDFVRAAVARELER